MGDAELTAYIEKNLPEREKFYNKANFVLDCSDASDSAILREIIQQIDDQNVKRS
jgi:hypothetical protein